MAQGASRGSGLDLSVVTGKYRPNEGTWSRGHDPACCDGPVSRRHLPRQTVSGHTTNQALGNQCHCEGARWDSHFSSLAHADVPAHGACLLEDRCVAAVAHDKATSPWHPASSLAGMLAGRADVRRRDDARQRPAAGPGQASTSRAGTDGRSGAPVARPVPPYSIWISGSGYPRPSTFDRTSARRDAVSGGCGLRSRYGKAARSRREGPQATIRHCCGSRVTAGHRRVAGDPRASARAHDVPGRSLGPSTTGEADVRCPSGADRSRLGTSDWIDPDNARSQAHGRDVATGCWHRSGLGTPICRSRKHSDHDRLPPNTTRPGRGSCGSYHSTTLTGRFA